MEAQLYEKYLGLERRHWWFQARREIIGAVLQRHLPPPASLVDVGSGTGFVLEHLGPLGYDAWGIDPSPAAIEACHARGLAQVQPGTAYDLSAAGDRRFDGALFLDVLEHLDDDARALREAHRVMKPGGLVFVTVPAFMFLWSDHDRTHQHRRRYVRTQLDSLLQDTGFGPELLSYYNCYLFPLAVAARLTGRLRRKDSYADLEPPTPWVNRTMRSVFASEKCRLTRPPRGGTYPVGLSLIAVAKRVDGRA